MPVIWGSFLDNRNAFSSCCLEEIQVITAQRLGELVCLENSCARSALGLCLERKDKLTLQQVTRWLSLLSLLCKHILPLSKCLEDIKEKTNKPLWSKSKNWMLQFFFCSDQNKELLILLVYISLNTGKASKGL